MLADSRPGATSLGKGHRPASRYSLDGGAPVHAGGGFELPSSSASSRRYLTNIAHAQMIATTASVNMIKVSSISEKSRAAANFRNDRPRFRRRSYISELRGKNPPAHTLHTWPATTRSRLPAPVQTENHTVTFDYG